MGRYAIGGETWLNGFRGLAVFYISDIRSERLDAGGTTECRLGVIFVTWCIIKFDWCVTFYITCIILIVDNYISYLLRKMIPWSWEVYDVTMTSDFSDHI